jgi:major membrane immunogen (membrane-anchored lipoprotein)
MVIVAMVADSCSLGKVSSVSSKNGTAMVQQLINFSLINKKSSKDYIALTNDDGLILKAIADYNDNEKNAVQLVAGKIQNASLKKRIAIITEILQP